MIARRAAAVFVAVAATAGVAWLSRLPSDFGGGAGATIRLSWRAAGVPVEDCRTRTDEELAALPVHMRSPQECTRALAPFELAVALGGQPVVRDTVFPKGARGDRPVYVFRDLPAAAGRVPLSITFEALPGQEAQPGDAPTRYAWDGVVEVASGHVALVTLDGEGKLVVRTPEVR